MYKYFEWVPVQVNGEIDPDQWYAVMPAQSLLEKGLEVKAFTPFLEHGPHRGKTGIFLHNFQSQPFQIRSKQRVGTIAGVRAVERTPPVRWPPENVRCGADARAPHGQRGYLA